MAFELRSCIAVVTHTHLYKDCDKARVKSAAQNPLPRDIHEWWAYEKNGNGFWQDLLSRVLNTASAPEVPPRRSEDGFGGETRYNKCCWAARKRFEWMVWTLTPQSRAAWLSTRCSGPLGPARFQNICGKGNHGKPRDIQYVTHVPFSRCSRCFQHKYRHSL